MKLTESVRSFHVPATPATAAWPAELAVGADLGGDAGDFVGEAGELVDHRVDRVLQLEHFAADVDGDLLGQVAAGDGGGDRGDVAHLGGEVAGHEVDRVGEVLPCAGDTEHCCLPAELAVGADLAGDARDFVGEAGQLVDHAVDRLGECGDLALGLDGDLLGQVAVGDRGGDLGDVAHLRGEVAGQLVDVLGEVLPGARHTLDLRLATEAALRAHLTRHAGDFVGERSELVDHAVDGLCECGDLALGLDGDLLRQVAVGDRGR
jgi:hypothetical protein